MSHSLGHSSPSFPRFSRKFKRHRPCGAVPLWLVPSPRYFAKSSLLGQRRALGVRRRPTVRVHTDHARLVAEEVTVASDVVGGRISDNGVGGQQGSLFNDTPHAEISPLPLHRTLPIYIAPRCGRRRRAGV